MKLRDLTHAAIQEAVVEWQKVRPRGRRRATGYSAKTINNTLSVLSDILGTAVGEGLIRDNPTQRQGGAARERLRVHAAFRELEYLYPDKITRYLDACDGEYHDLGAVLALAGMPVRIPLRSRSIACSSASDLGVTCLSTNSRYMAIITLLAAARGFDMATVAAGASGRPAVARAGSSTLNPDARGAPMSGAPRGP